MGDYLIERIRWMRSPFMIVFENKDVKTVYKISSIFNAKQYR